MVVQWLMKWCGMINTMCSHVGRCCCCLWMVYICWLSGIICFWDLVERDISPGVLELLDALLDCYLLLSQTWPVDGRTVIAVLHFCGMHNGWNMWWGLWYPGWDWASWSLLGTSKWVLLFTSLIGGCFCAHVSRFAPLHFFSDHKNLIGMLGKGVR